jgi:two-component system, chemotaxis family, chemotaxis protein CheY
LADKSMHVLIVDDPAMIRIVRGLMQQLGFTNVDAVSGADTALDKMAEKDYGLIISDWNMEPMTGLDLLKEIRKRGNKVPFIMVTSESKTENVLAAREAGVNSYIVKPFSADTFKLKLENVLGEI